MLKLIGIIITLSVIYYFIVLPLELQNCIDTVNKMVCGDGVCVLYNSTSSNQAVFAPDQQTLLNECYKKYPWYAYDFLI